MTLFEYLAIAFSLVYSLAAFGATFSQIRPDRLAH